MSEDKTFLDLQKARRSVYALGRDVDMTDAQLEDLFKETIKETPSAFNSQTVRAVFAFGDQQDALWDMIIERMRQVVGDPEAFKKTEAKLNGFKKAYGTVLLYTDTDAVKELEENNPAYAQNFYDWSEQTIGISSYALWLAAREHNLGGNLQHYNPVIDEDIKAAYGIPDSWRLRAQFVFGSIEQPAGAKDYIDDDVRFKSLN
ncbi:putative oxidoreductase (fatty acid repression mutant protein) [Weissella uvarum]|uniref:nitroreductase family protein n=1 Tax=Weissella uvarum TaxID=1479233 RepID=UPI00195F29F3|nr:nitroreductase family protein [Weissella uvarum]MBM7617223.1 putative oxidoreductase (fatty acid repression mutant protein) [Weissella uvarum]MCM0595516.1 nitroreductase family protein [Weissella uvarum]